MSIQYLIFTNLQKICAFFGGGAVVQPVQLEVSMQNVGSVTYSCGKCRSVSVTV
jgi:hypothetical protein